MNRDKSYFDIGAKEGKMTKFNLYDYAILALCVTIVVGLYILFV